MMPVLEETLTGEQITQFARDGYVILRGLFRPAEIAQIRETFMSENAQGPVPGLSDGHAATDSADPLSFYPRMMNPHLHVDLTVGPLAKRYMLDRRLYPVLKTLFGEEPLAVQSMFYFKPPKARGQELHQDNFYLRVKPGTCLAAWIAIDDVDAENGGMKVVPGSHKLEIFCPEHADSSVSFTTDYVPVPSGMTPVQADMQAGDVLFFNGSLIHGSTANQSENRFRRSLIFHYAPLESQEIAHWYREPTTFDGRVMQIAPATGGGPCGVSDTQGPH